MNWQRACQTYGYADDGQVSGSFPPDQATRYGSHDVYDDTYLKVPARQEYARSSTADSACRVSSKAASLKRRSCDHESNSAELARGEGKRAKRPITGTRAERTDGEYFCTHPGCERKFDRLCEAKKHFRAKHTPLQLKPHGCTIDECEFRGMWPKDIRRHLKQKHGVIAPKAMVVNILAHCPSAATSVSYEGARALASSPAHMTRMEGEAAKRPRMAMLAQTFSVLKKLRIRSHSSDDSAKKFIMVTKDGAYFRDVDVTGADTLESVVQRITHSLGVPDSEMSNATWHRWSRFRGAGPHLPRHALLSLVSKAADAEGTLRLFLKRC